MKVWKLVSGILSIIFSGWVMLGSGVAGFLNDLDGSKADSATAVAAGFLCQFLCSLVELFQSQLEIK